MKIEYSYYKKLLQLAIPVTLSQLGIQMVSIFDTIMVGKLGKIELAAIAFGGSVFFFFFLFLIGICIGLTTIVGSYFLKNRIKKISSLFQNSIVLFFSIGLVFFSVLYLTRNILLSSLNQPLEVVEKAIPYYEYMLWSIIPFMLYSAFKQMFEGIGNTVVNMVLIFVVNAINLFLNWIFIYGNLGMPQMGGAGAGLASLIATSCLPVFAIVYAMSNRYTKSIIKLFRWKNFSLFQIQKLFLLGFPIALQLFIENFAFVATSIMTGWMCVSELAANQIAIKLASLSFMIVLGINSAATIMISHKYGVKDLTEIKKYAFASYRMTIIWSLFITLIFIIFRFKIAGIFVTDADFDVILIAADLIICVAIFQISDGLQSISVGILRGLQDVRSLIPISLIAYIVIDIPLGYFLAFVVGLKALGLWISFFFGLSFAGILYSRRIKISFKNLKVTK